jgi:4-amino-4-deoxy-L-arabinose transferase-like glycosyltransferase
VDKRAAFVVILVALTVRILFWSEIRGTPLDAWHRWDQTDMATFLAQAQRLVDGDWLGREPYHPYATWQERAGTAEDWLRWYGPRAFHQAPLYSYALAAATLASGRSIDLVKLLQIVLGVASCLLIAGIARSIGGEATALAAGLIAALYAPLYYLEVQLLREGPAVFGLAGLLWLLSRRPDAPWPTQRPWLIPALVGILLGVYATFYETASVLTLAAAIVLTVRAGRRSGRLAVVVAVAFTCGWLVGFAPLLLRNVAVGSPPLATSSRLGVNLAYANMSEAAGGGALFTPPGPQLARIMDASGGSVAGVLREVWRSYEGHPSRLFLNLGRRFATLWTAVELPDNTSFEFYRRQSSILAFSLTFPWIFAPASAAMLLVTGNAWIRRRTRAATPLGDPPGVLDQAWTGHSAAHGTLLTFLPLLVAALIAVHPQARYRLLVTPILIVYAALFLTLSARAFRARERGTLGALIVSAAVLFAAQAAASAPLRPIVERPVDYAAAAHIALAEGRPEIAVGYYRDGIAVHAHEVGLRVELANTLANMGRYAEAIEQLKVVTGLRPDLAQLNEVIARLEALQAGR